jgi:hypothetical protein
MERRPLIFVFTPSHSGLDSRTLESRHRSHDRSGERYSSTKIETSGVVVVALVKCDWYSSATLTTQLLELLVGPMKSEGERADWFVTAGGRAAGDD